MSGNGKKIFGEKKEINSKINASSRKKIEIFVANSERL